MLSSQFLVGLTLLCCACESRTAPHRVAGETSAAALPGPMPAAPAEPFLMPAPLDAPSRRDSLGPVALAWQLVSLSGLRPDPSIGLLVDTLLGGFMQVREVGAAPRLFYKTNLRAAQWMEMDLALPEFDGDDWTGATLTLDTANLDRRGAPEVLVTVDNSHYGSGGGRRWAYKCVVDVTKAPIRLLGALAEIEDENFGRDNDEPDGRTHDPDYERTTGWVRRIELKRDIVVGEAEGLGRDNGDNDLTKLAAGRYRYQGGRVFRVGK
ncbi:hypothetical protein [Hymenobacter arizonensis]|uniref:Uncharacterized protein n=1 Tax=Hymenobacter arizonensis TaxID=1227077 RepID=A0A1I6AE96_HYMAR|nr:hypothetical protein [Hymenobacter arizonensis]SFQ66867.1 hypothetical protein SAMN04515668_3586 [Hymenobacter arizonensis]